MAIVEVKQYRKGDKDKAAYYYYTCVKIKGDWYIFDTDMKTGDNAKIKTIANNWSKWAEKSSKDDD